MKALLALFKQILAFGRKLLALVCDEDFDLDAFRIAGIAAFVSAIYIALIAVSYVRVLDSTKLGILTGLVTALISIGSTTFAQARKGDDSRISASKASDSASGTKEGD